MLAPMNGKGTDPSTHTVLVIDRDRRIVDEQVKVPGHQLASLIADLRSRFGAGVRVLVDGVTVDESLLARATKPEPVHVLTDRGTDPVQSVELAHAMLWDTYDRAARVQSWMLEQASAFTLDLLENNKRLADQASELQKRYQTALAEIDYTHREQKMMEAEEAASRYSRHLIEKAKAEIAAALPQRTGTDIIDDIIDGAAVALGAICGQARPRGPRNTN